MEQTSMKYIECVPGRCGGKPVIKGHRFTIEQMLVQISMCGSIDEFCEDFAQDKNEVLGALMETHLLFDKKYKEPDDVN